MKGSEGIGHWVEERISTSDGEIGVTVQVLRSPRPGLKVLVLGGVHGNEVGGTLAAARLTSSIGVLRSGSVAVVPVAHEAAHHAFSRTGPADGENLARCFPGQPDGTPTQRLAALLGERLIRSADVLVDLHTSSPDADMPFFAGGLDDGSEIATRGTELAVAFGAGIVWTHPTVGVGRTLSLAQELGIPALYVESPRGGVLDRRYLTAYVDGVKRVLAKLGLLDMDMPTVDPPRLWLHDDGDTDAFVATPVDGWFLSEVDLLDAVTAGQTVGRVVDRHGTSLHEVVASSDGVVVTLRTTAPVTVGTPLIGLAAPRPASLGLPSDVIAPNEGARP